MDGVVSHVGSTYLLLINAEERLFFPRRQRLRPHSGAFAGAGVGEAEGNEIVHYLQFISSPLSRE